MHKEARKEAALHYLLTVQPELRDEYTETVLREDIAGKYELRYAADGSKRIVAVKGQAGWLNCCSSNGTEASPCCERAKGAINESVPAMLNPFTPPVPPSTPRKIDIRSSSASGQLKHSAKTGCVMC